MFQRAKNRNRTFPARDTAPGSLLDSQKLRTRVDASSVAWELRVSAPLVPSTDTVYLVFEDFGKFGRVYRETPEDGADRETIIQNVFSGEYDKLLRVVAFNIPEGWSRDVTRDIAQEVARRRSGPLPEGAAALLE